MATNEIQFSFELEGSHTDGISTFYRPRDITDEAWALLSLKEQRDSLHRHTWHELVRRDAAPSFLPDELNHTNDSSKWEVAMRGYVTTLKELFERAAWAKENLDPQGGFHFHVSFRASADQADAIVAFGAHAAEHTSLEGFANDFGRMMNPFLGPHDSQDLETIHEAISFGATYNAKMSTFGFRNGYGVYENDQPVLDWRGGQYVVRRDEKRMGYEYRAAENDLDKARHVLTNTVSFLEKPAEARLKLGDLGNDYRPSDLVTRAHPGLDAFAALPEPVRRVLERAAEAVVEHMNEQFTRQESLAEKDLLIRWSLPLVKWESHTYMPEEARRGITAARLDFLKRVSELAAEYPPGTKVGPEVQDTLEWLVLEWLNRSQIWRYM